MPSQQPVWHLRSQGPAAVESWKNVAVTTMCMESVQRVGQLFHTNKKGVTFSIPTLSSRMLLFPFYIFSAHIMKLSLLTAF